MKYLGHILQFIGAPISIFGASIYAAGRWLAAR